MTTPLEKNQILTLGHKHYHILDIAGSGGSSIVYKAQEVNYSGDTNYGEYCVIKELYPHNLSISRNPSGSLSIPIANQEAFEKMKKRAKREPQIANALRHDQQAKSNSEWIWLYSPPVSLNNTLYTVIATGKGEMLSDQIDGKLFADKSFTDICDCILKILTALEPIHASGYLHLDISPDNIHLAELGIARLIDFNAAFRIGDEGQDWIPSIKPGYSARELMAYTKKTKPTILSRATDLYSVGAIFFEMLVGKIPTDEILEKRSLWLQSNEKGHLKNASDLLVKKVNGFLLRSLAMTPARRFQSISEMRIAIGELKAHSVERVLVNNTIRPYPHFVGRQSELGEIDRLLTEDNFVILEGLGGIGKTELAKRYTSDYRYKYDIVQFITFNESLLATINTSLKFKNFDYASYHKDYPEAQVEQAIFDAKMSCLQVHDQRTLIVIDNYNVDQDDNFYRLVDKNNEYKVIFTSRLKHEENGIEIAKLNTIQDLLGLFSEYFYGDSTVKFSPQEEPLIKEIINRVNGHTMTIMLYAISMAKDKISPQKMLAILEKSLSPKLPTKFSVKKDESAERQAVYGHIQALFNMSDGGLNIEFIDADDTEEGEITENDVRVYIMANMSLVPYSGLEVETFHQWVLSHLYESNEYGMIDRTELNWLIERRWIEYDSQADKLSLHPVISEAVYDTLMPDSDICFNLLDGLATHAIENLEKTHVEHRDIAEKLSLACKRLSNDKTEDTGIIMYLYSVACAALANYSAALQWATKAHEIFEDVYGKDHPESVDAKIFIARIHGFLGDYPKTLALYQDVLAAKERELGREHEEVAMLYHNIGQVHFSQGAQHTALEWYQRALDIQEKVLGNNHPNTASTYGSIATIHNVRGEHAKALALQQRALAIEEANLDKNSNDIAFSYYNMGVGYHRKGDYSAALEWHQKAIDIFEKTLGCDHPTTADSYSQVAGVYSDQGEYYKALELMHRVLDINIKALGSQHPSIVTDYVSIGLAYTHLGEYPLSLEWLNKALEIQEKVHGSNHPDTAILYGNIAQAYTSMSMFSQAKEWFKKALTAEKSMHGIKRPETGLFYNNIGHVYHHQGDFNKALEWFHKALDIQEELLGSQHPDTGLSYNNIGYAYAALGDYHKAVLWLNKSLESFEEVLGHEHPNLAFTYNNLGMVHYNKGDYLAAQECYQKALKIHDKVFNMKHPISATIQSNVGMVYSTQGHHQKALEWFNSALETAEAMLGKDHPDTGRICNNIGSTYSALNEHEAALMWFDRALVMEDTLGEEHPMVATTYNNLAMVYNAQGDYDKALEWLYMTLDTKEKTLGKMHPETALTHYNIGYAYHHKGDVDAALGAYFTALDIQEEVLGKMHPDTGKSYGIIGVILFQAGEGNEAMEWCKKAEAVYETFLGKDHPSTIELYEIMAQFYEALEDHALAQVYKAKAGTP